LVLLGHRSSGIPFPILSRDTVPSKGLIEWYIATIFLSSLQIKRIASGTCRSFLRPSAFSVSR
jgi:hypothetical protein